MSLKKIDIESLKSSISIIELSKKLGLTPNHQNYISSIYKEEKTPSMKLYPETNTYYCFSTGQGGNVFTLYAITQNLDIKKDFIKIIKSIRVMFGLSDEYEENKPLIRIKKKTTSIASINTNTINGSLYSNIYQHFIGLCPIKGQGKEYLESRGFDINFLTTRKLGYISSNSYNRISTSLLEKFDIKDLKLSGLFNELGKFKGFTNSIIIPYLDELKKPVNLQFRLLSNEFTNSKYLFLSKIKKPCYGVDEYIKGNLDIIADDKNEKILYFTEGVFDCLMVKQLEINSVAIPSAGDGNLLTDEEIGQLINKFDKLVLAFDNDTAGQKLTQEFGNRLYALGAKNILVKFLPEGVKDINELILNN